VAATAAPSPIKSYVGILIDRRFNSIKKKEEPTAYLMNCLRYRIDVCLDDFGDKVSTEATEGQSLRSKKSLVSSTKQTKMQTSLYDTLLNLLGEFDASGRAEIFRLLLERRSGIPLFLPNGENHLAVFRLLNKAIDDKRFVCVGKDVNLLRLTVISCRKKTDSKAAELLKEVFHLDTLHREDFAKNCFTRELMTAEIGLGCIVPLNKTLAPVHLLVLHVVGDFDQLWDFIKAFSDYLIIEDATSEEERFYRRPQFSNYKGDPNCPGLEGIKSVLVWKPSLDGLVSDFYDGNENQFGFEHLQISTSLGKAFLDAIVSDLLDPEAAHWKTGQKKRMLHELESLLPGESKGIECSVPFKFKPSIENLRNFSSLRDNALLLQKSFNKQAEFEEEKAHNRNDESTKVSMNHLISKEVALRKEKAATVEKHPLLQLFLDLLRLEDVSLRVLGFREFEMSLAYQSEIALSPLRSEVDKYAIQYGELSQSKNVESSELEEASMMLQKVKKRYNNSVVSTEHVWRELSHLYVANPSKHGELI